MSDRGDADAWLRSDWFNALIRAKYPGVAHIEFNTDPATQLRGIDVCISLQNGFCDSWEVKFRKELWFDIAMEDRHERSDGIIKPGWANSELWCQKLAYCFVSERFLLLMRWPDLRRVWRLNREAWRLQWGEICSQQNNEGYRTICIPVPLQTLWDMIPIERIR